MAKSKEEKESKKESIYLSADYITEREPIIVPTTPTLDLALGGGIEEGTTTIISSEPKIGKSTLGLQIIANGQKLGKVGVYVPVEERPLFKNLTGIKGLDLSPEMFKIIGSSEGDILSAESYLERAERALIEFPGCVMVFDSFSALCSSNELTNTYMDQTMGGSSKLQAKFCRRTAGIINVNRCILIGIVHKQANFSGYGGPTDNMGKKLQYKMDIRLQAKKLQPFEWKSGDDIVGQRVQIDVDESSLGPPGKTANLWLRYGQGFSQEAEIIDLATELGLILKGGAWYTLPGDKKFQGWDNVYNYLIENTDAYNDIAKQVREMLK